MFSVNGWALHRRTMARDWNKLLTFPMERRVTIQVWEVGLFHLVLQLLVVCYVGYSLYYSDAWAYSEEPVGSVNAWPEAGVWERHASVADFGADLSYCDPAATSYAYDESFVMDDPVCLIVNPLEVSAKEAGTVHFTTAFIEYRDVGWSCDAPHNATRWLECLERSGSVDASLEGGRQCVCSSQRTVYPVGVDLMVLAFEHGFSGALKFADRSGSSMRPAGSAGAVDTTVEFANATGAKRTYASGAAVRLSVADAVAIATATGLTLDDVNRDLR